MRVSSNCMAQSWANSGLDLYLGLAGHRHRAGLESALREAVRSGRLAPGTRLPATRQLAADLGLSRNTVADAYGQLIAEGWLAAWQGAGTWVAGGAAPPPVNAAAPAVTADRGVRYDLRPGLPDLAAFPRPAWLAAARRALTSAPVTALGYGDPRGLPQLRAALAGYLSRARGVTVTPDRVVVCSGFAQALELLCEVLRSRGGQRLAVEGYGQPQHGQLAAAKGLLVTALPVDGGGAVVEALGGADGVLLTPAHQFPLGVALEPRRRRQVTGWAAQAGALVIEDDYDGEFRYDRQAVGALQALAPESVAYAGTASKSLAPGLRLGWLVLPAALVDDVVAAKSQARRFSSSLDQLALAEFISSGAYDRHVRQSRLAYRRRRDTLIAALRREAPQARVTGIAAGLHVLVHLAAGQREEDLVADAAARGLAIEGLSVYAAAPASRPVPALVLGYATPPSHAFTAALARLTATLRSH
jgi:GntR family transcriptional regulator/MocR family aminotransferase